MNIHILASTLWHTKIQLRFVSLASVYTHTDLNIPANYAPNEVSFFLARSSNSSHTNHQRYSEPFRSLENNKVFFTSNSNGLHAHQTGFSFQAIIMTATPIRQHTVNHSFYLDNMHYTILMAHTPTKHDAVNHCVH